MARRAAFLFAAAAIGAVGCHLIAGTDEFYARSNPTTGATGGEAGTGAGGTGAGGTGAGGTGAGGSGGALPPGPGYALQFDGGDTFVSIARTIADDFTMEAWINTSESANLTDYWRGNAIISGDVSGNHEDFMAALISGVFSFGVGSTASGSYQVDSTSDVTTGQWVHVAAVRTRSSGTIAVFVNGVEEDSASSGAHDLPLTAPSQLLIGGNNVSGRHFGGVMDEVRIWEVARSGPEIQATMNTPLWGTEPGLVGYWRFDDGSGPTATDSSPTGNHGALGIDWAAPLWVVSDAPIAPP